MTGTKVEDGDLKAIARDHVRQQFAQIGYSDVPDDLLEEYAAKQLESDDNRQQYVEQILDQKLVPELKKMVKLNVKDVTIDEFRKMMEESDTDKK